MVFEIKNGKGKIKEYYDNGRLLFEGEYLNGLRNGKGKEYNIYLNENKRNRKRKNQGNNNPGFEEYFNGKKIEKSKMKILKNIIILIN